MFTLSHVLDITNFVNHGMVKKNKKFEYLENREQNLAFLRKGNPFASDDTF